MAMFFWSSCIINVWTFSHQKIKRQQTVFLCNLFLTRNKEAMEYLKKQTFCLPMALMMKMTAMRVAKFSSVNLITKTLFSRRTIIRLISYFHASCMHAIAVEVLWSAWRLLEIKKSLLKSCDFKNSNFYVQLVFIHFKTFFFFFSRYYQKGFAK